MSLPSKTTNSSSSNTNTSTTTPPTPNKNTSPLIEIIHLHDCLRGSIRLLENDISLLSQNACVCHNHDDDDDDDDEDEKLNDESHRLRELERRVAGRFKVLWSVFRAHSAAEDEFIWPALKEKLSSKDGEGGGGGGGCCGGCGYSTSSSTSSTTTMASRTNPPTSSSSGEVTSDLECSKSQCSSPPMDTVVQEEYEEDHADEERMFMEMDSLLSQIRHRLNSRHNKQQKIQKQQHEQTPQHQKPPPPSHSPSSSTNCSDCPVCDLSQTLQSQTKLLTHHLFEHLKKEEVECMPLVEKHLTRQEINDLVGRIMGKRSSDLMGQILTMAVQNLPPVEREDMVKYMKQAMVGTFFESWLEGCGWGGDLEGGKGGRAGGQATTRGVGVNTTTSSATSSSGNSSTNNTAIIPVIPCDDISPPSSPISSSPPETKDISPSELERLIRSVAANSNLTSMQKTTVIQGLRDSVWKSRTSAATASSRPSNKRRAEDISSSSVEDEERRQRHQCQTGDEEGDSGKVARMMASTSSLCSPVVAAGGRVSSGNKQRLTPPSAYYKKNRETGVVEMVWISPSNSTTPPPITTTPPPLFSASELAPTYHDGATRLLLGCPHYARACKLRHPSSGRLYTCRLCCEQERDNPLKEQDSPLDRYAVTEVLCMRCQTLQPAGRGCVHPTCPSNEEGGKGGFARYCCKICNLYDDGAAKSIYHCPFCNVCRSGKGLGIDYRHCMRCNACVSLLDDNHTCIPQRLQGHCPICRESMFESTEPLRGLKCGHVMHLSCFSHYILRGQAYTCPLCKKSVDDMKEYFSLLDAALRMQPMPEGYSRLVSQIYCQDCGKTGEVKYHFVGCKCGFCGSYNTREIERSERGGDGDGDGDGDGGGGGD